MHDALAQSAATERERERVREAVRAAVDYLDNYLPRCFGCTSVAGRHVDDCESLELIDLINELRELSAED